MRTLSKESRDNGYQCLVGRHFAVDEQVYIVGSLRAYQRHTIVEAHKEQDRASTVRFFLTDVLEALLIDEEIELFQPGYLGG